MRQWSTFHPEFSYLPRKFKIAVNGAARTAPPSLVHDIGLHALRNDAGEVGFRVIVGGGMGRTPIIGQVIREFLPWPHLLTYLEAILRVYNRYGRRDNIYKARIKILVKDAASAGSATRSRPSGHDARGRSRRPLSAEDVAPHRSRASAYPQRPPSSIRGSRADRRDRAFAAWAKRNVHAHRVPGYARGHALAQEDRRAAGRRDARPDGCDRRPRRALLASASCASRTSRT